MTVHAPHRRRRSAFAVFVSRILTLLTLLALALFASGVAAFFTARHALDHRGTPPALTPADSLLPFDVVPLQARDGTKLEGWWIPPRDGVRRADLATVVLAHGADGTGGAGAPGKASMLRQAAFLHRAGYILLLFDFRSYGGSAGRRSTAGVLETQDLEAALRLARERALGAPIAVLGEGLGATAGLVVAAQDPAIVALVADSPALRWREALLAQDRVRAFLPSRVAWPPLTWAFVSRELGPAFRSAEARDPLDAAALAGARPVLLIAGAADRQVAARDRAALRAALGPANASWAWTAPAAGHAQALASDPAEYRSRVLEFLDAAMAEWGRRRGNAAAGAPGPSTVSGSASAADSAGQGSP
jgi:pimeloyl-ACP methyl ester carboxylesterase